MAEGFLGRWSRRKLEVKEGREVEAEASRPDMPPPQPTPRGGGGQDPFPPPLGEGQGGGAPALETAVPAEPPPTLEDTHLLTPASDFSRFVRPDVAPAVRNAALKKLFTDPHFNVQDGLDVYIGDYTRPDPIPQAMLRTLESARSLGLFRDEQAQGESQAGTGACPEQAGSESVAQSNAPQPEVPAGDAHPDLRLQQDDAPAGGDPGPGPG